MVELADDVDLMNKSLDEGLSTNAPGTTAPGTTAPGTSAPGTAAPTTKTPSTKAPTTNTPTTDAPVEDEKDKTIRELREKLTSAEADTKKTPKTEHPTTEAPLKLDEQDFAGDIDLDELTRDKNALNKLLNTVYSKAVSDTRKVLGEGVLRSIPDIVKTNIVTQATLKEASEKFYNDNEDLKAFPKVVAVVFEELASNAPGKPYSEIIKEVAPEVRKRLNLQTQATKPKEEKKDPPRLPHKGKNPSRGTEKPNLSNIEAELDAMDKSLGGN